LKDNILLTTYTVENRSNTEMPFAVGGHPAFAVPFFKGETYNDYAILFSNDSTFTRHHINSEGLFDGRISSVESRSNAIQLERQLFAEDALIFKNLQSKEVSIVSHKHKKRLKMNIEGFPYLGIWAKTGADYVCLEPWIGCADVEGFTGDFSHKEAVQLLAPGNSFHVTYTTEIEI
jgi:galactose mutarotase-like enzyme